MRAILRDSHALDVTVDDPGAFFDVDTPEDYEELLARLDRGAEL